jgi:cobalt-precorrin-6B (C15)-methyltransferase
MGDTKPAGGPTQDEIMAISLFKMGLSKNDVVLDLGCGTGKVSIALAQQAQKVYAVDRRPEAIRYAQDEAQKAGITNIEFFSGDAMDFLDTDLTFDCAFVGGSKQIAMVLPCLAQKVRRRIVVNVVLTSTLSTVVETMQRLDIFREVIHVQVSRSHGVGAGIMFKPIDPVYVIVGTGAAC